MMDKDKKEVWLVIGKLGKGGVGRVYSEFFIFLKRKGVLVNKICLIGGEDCLYVLNEKSWWSKVRDKGYYSIIFFIYFLLCKIKKVKVECVYLFSENVSYPFLKASKYISLSDCIIVTIHNTPVWSGVFLKNYVSLLNAVAHKVLVVSPGIKNKLIDFGVDENKIVVGAAGLDLEYIRCRSRAKVGLYAKRPYLISVSRLDKNKSIDVLIRALSFSKNKSVDLMILGDGPEESSLKQLVKTLGLESRVFFGGHVDNPYPYIKRSKYLVVSSINEGFGLAIVEAMSLGVPVISFKCLDGPSFIIEDKKDGFLLDCKDKVASLSRMIDSISDVDDDAYRVLSKNAYKKSLSFSMDKVGCVWAKPLFKC